MKNGRVAHAFCIHKKLKNFTNRLIFNYIIKLVKKQQRLKLYFFLINIKSVCAILMLNDVSFPSYKQNSLGCLYACRYTIILQEYLLKNSFFRSILLPLFSLLKSDNFLSNTQNWVKYWRNVFFISKFFKLGSSWIKSDLFVNNSRRTIQINYFS